MENNSPLALFPFNFDLDKAKIFYYVVQAGSITKAAEILNKEQPTISRSMIRLESELNFLLFNRTSRGIKPTRKGEELAKITEEYLLNLKKFHETNKNPETHVSRTLRIGIDRSFLLFITNDLKEYCFHNKKIMLEIVECSSLSQFIGLNLDVAFVPFHKKIAGFEQLPLRSVPKSFLNSEIIKISSKSSEEEGEEIDLFFSIPDYFKEDKDIKSLYERLMNIA